MEPEKVCNWLTSGDRLQQYERGKVQCRQSGERYLPIWKKKVTTCYIQCYTALYYVICYYKLSPSLGNSSWCISCLNVLWSGTEPLSLEHLIPHITYCHLPVIVSYICYCEKRHQTWKDAFKKDPLLFVMTTVNIYKLLHFLFRMYYCIIRSYSSTCSLPIKLSDCYRIK